MHCIYMLYTIHAAWSMHSQFHELWHQLFGNTSVDTFRLNALSLSMN